MVDARVGEGLDFARLDVEFVLHVSQQLWTPFLSFWSPLPFYITFECTISDNQASVQAIITA
jgi:hypothetical protein